ncbi:hypothetical protein BpHYR1_004352 [Brachionus plicatilis]|uniref:Uncharacterized protein n=1 Tax=Brachionus plicatilis TaxID=10195 RepID=A0A3M7QIQ5_BRAPC|nr:hypothetical protein BpHYR1_004352 [Brachionus plicatilis]
MSIFCNIICSRILAKLKETDIGLKSSGALDSVLPFGIEVTMHSYLFRISNRKSIIHSVVLGKLCISSPYSPYFMMKGVLTFVPYCRDILKIFLPSACMTNTQTIRIGLLKKHINIANNWFCDMIICHKN